MRQTPLAQLVEMKLGAPLREHVVAARSVTGPRARQAGWRTIAADLTRLTGISLSSETVRSWFDDELNTPAQTQDTQVPA